MSVIFVVAFDEDDGSRRALDFAIQRAKMGNAEIRLAHVLAWSPYSFLTPEELEERHKRRGEELARASKGIAPVVEEIRGKGVAAEAVVRYGNVAETLCSLAKELNAVQIFVGRAGSTTLADRVFGSVPGALVQAAPVPVTVVP